MALLKEDALVECIPLTFFFLGREVIFYLKWIIPMGYRDWSLEMLSFQYKSSNKSGVGICVWFRREIHSDDTYPRYPLAPRVFKNERSEEGD